MRIEQVGEGDPELAVVGGIHGDEPCGPAAIDHFVSDPPAVERPVAFVLANELAIERGVRYVDEDLNRAFPGDHEADAHEGRLAAAIRDAIGDCPTLSLHSTQSYGEPFGIVDGVHEFAWEVAPKLSIEALVDAGEFDGGRIFESVPDTIEVECGFQGTAGAAANAIRLTEEFLAALGALPPESIEPSTAAEGRSIPVFRLEDSVPKGPADRYEVHVANFELVDAGEPFAATDGEQVNADESFYPVLMSAEGYEELFGYTASLAGELP